MNLSKKDILIFILFLISLGIGFLIGFWTAKTRFDLHELKVLDAYVEKYSVDNVIDRVKRTSYSEVNGFSFAVFGDTRGSFLILDKIWSRIANENVLMAFCVGDLVNHGYAGEFKNFLEIIDDEDTPFLAVIGNHDVGHDKLEYQYVFGSLNYYFDYQNTRFIALDSSEEGLDAEQLDWLDKRLAEVPDYRKFVFTHKPPCTVEKWAYHSFESGADEFVTVLTKHKVDGVFMGHIHAYSTELYNGIRYTVTGGGGASLHDELSEENSVYHYIVVSVKNGKIRQEVVKYKWIRELVGKGISAD